MSAVQCILWFNLFCYLLPTVRIHFNLLQWLTRRQAHLLRAQQGIPISEFGVCPGYIISIIHFTEFSILVRSLATTIHFLVVT